MLLATRRGFTLIEILVVTAIIGLLAAVVMASLGTARKRSRDARRVSDLKSLQGALELYIAENKVSPATGSLNLLAPNYIAVIPPDPSGGTNEYGYTQSGQSGYVLGTVLEQSGQLQPLTTDYDASVSITISGVATNCNTNAGLVTEAVYCAANP